LKKYKSEGKAVEVTVNSKEETLQAFVWISSENPASLVNCKRLREFEEIVIYQGKAV
jgi:hypothetical protein